MPIDITSLSTLGGSWILLSGSIWKLSEKAESVISEDVKSQVSSWLHGFEPTTTFLSWARTFEAAFDSVFGSRHLSWRCFRRSCLASILSVCAATLLWGILRPAEFMSFFVGGDWGGAWFIFPTFLLFINIVPDYLSLLESRWVIKWMSQSRSHGQVALWILFDLAVTTVIAIFAFSIVTAIFIRLILLGGFISGGIWNDFLDGMTNMVDYGLPLKAMDDEDITPGVFFYSTFFTSAWVLLHSASIFLIRIAQRAGTISSALKVILNIDQKPFLSVASIMVMILALAHLAMLPLVFW